MTRLRRDEDGFTLLELLAGMAVGTVVLLAAYGLIDSSGKSHARTRDRVDAVARSRIAMEEITRQLRSQVCVSPTDPSLVEATDDRVQFFGSLAPTGSATGEQVTQFRDIRFIPAERRIVERVHAVTGTPPDITVAAAPTTERTLVAGISRVPGVPVFRYFKYDATYSPNMVQLAPPVSPADRQLTVTIDVTFDSFPEGQADARSNTRVTGRAFMRTADPSDPEHSPKCI